VTAELESARLEWEEAASRFEQALRDPRRAASLEAELEIVLTELRRRIGATYTLRDLGLAYRDAETWVREALAERAPGREWLRRLSLVEGAAFHAYARGALDYGT
jgi:alcohol dehydrogenase class IV